MATGARLSARPRRGTCRFSPARSSDPTFELVYWRFGLTLAARWRARLGLPPVAAWQAVLARLCAPTARPLRGAAGAPRVYYPYARSGDDALIGNGVAPQAPPLLPVTDPATSHALP